ncbi:hypothetical protein [Sphingopyxis sp. PET50]|uniref:hypothetical protein n=1 Tax=Sphingopyxis sp. PET50 TaxID=2976533 RepID=UPI0021AF6DEE|nr:hypothetical protein [Sphingopyxis sp. PET50]
MRFTPLIVTGATALLLSACSNSEEVAYAPPPPPGAVAGSVAADRDGDGIIDGYYTSDGVYHPNQLGLCPAATPAADPRGRKGLIAR